MDIVRLNNHSSLFKIDVSLFGFCTRFSCNLIKVIITEAKITILPIHPLYPILSVLTRFRNWQLNEVHISDLNWRQFYHFNVSTYTISIISKNVLLIYFLQMKFYLPFQGLYLYQQPCDGPCWLTRCHLSCWSPTWQPWTGGWPWCCRLSGSVSTPGAPHTRNKSSFLRKSY